MDLLFNTYYSTNSFQFLSKQKCKETSTHFPYVTKHNNLENVQLLGNKKGIHQATKPNIQCISLNHQILLIWTHCLTDCFPTNIHIKNSSRYIHINCCVPPGEQQEEKWKEYIPLLKVFVGLTNADRLKQKSQVMSIFPDALFCFKRLIHLVWKQDFMRCVMFMLQCYK